MKIIPVPVREDNYAYIMHSTPTQPGARPQAVFVDVYDVQKVRSAAHKLSLEDSDIVGLITTHGHYDHAGGNGAFAKQYPNVPIYGGSSSITAVNHVVKDGDKFPLFTGGNGSAPVNITALATPCHTRDSICFFAEDPREEAELAKLGVRDGPTGEKRRAVFTGDTLFISGCGRFFEGDATDMHHALNEVLAQLPGDTLIYCGHEYTKGNAAFSAAVLSDNPQVQQLVRDIQTQRNGGMTTGLYTLDQEKRHNPFMMTSMHAVQQAIGASDEVNAMKQLRDAKNAGSMRRNI